MFMHIKDVKKPEYEGKTVKLRGWVYRHRASSKLVFIVLRDATEVIQGIIKKEENPGLYEKGRELYIESSLWLEGVIRKDERAPGGYEIKITNLEPYTVGEPFPITKDQSIEHLLDNRHLWIRSRKLTQILEARHHIVSYLREFLNKNGFYEIPAPVITKSGAEGGSEMFEVDYFGEKAYLTQSSQMYGESFIYSLEKIYIFEPSFRAEPSRTRRHLTEYWHLEPEMAFYDHEMNMELQEKMVEYVAHKLAEEHRDLVRDIGRDPKDLLNIKTPFQRMTYEEAIEKVNELGGKMEYGDDFGADEEYLLTKDLKQPIFITNFPKEIKAFYMKEDPNKPGTVLNDDMLAPEGYGEIIGGSERIWKYDELLERMKEAKLPIENYKWYLDLRRYGSVPHSGFGLGVERFVMWLLKLDHIRDTLPYPRVMNRVYP